MSEGLELRDPWLVAVWPGMGHVALNAGVYLLSKLGMNLLAEFEMRDLFDVNQVNVKEGIIQPAKPPRNRLFVWQDPGHAHDLVLFIGEAQPPLGKYAFCRQVLTHAKMLGVKRVYTFAAMATQMQLRDPSRVFCAATDGELLAELTQKGMEVLDGGEIGGLNGVLLGAAAEEGLRGACLLGEMPHVFSQLPFPKASLKILEAFGAMTGIQPDLTEMAEQSQVMEQQLGALLAQVEGAYERPAAESEEQPEYSAEPEVDALVAADLKRIEELFQAAEQDRSKAFELKQELDRLGRFKEFQDRFLDLFQKRK